MHDLHDRVAIVTGASRGGGRGIALELATAGATVYVTGRSTRTQPAPGYEQFLAASGLPAMPGTIDDVVDEITAAGGRAIAVRCDHGDPEQVRALFAQVCAQCHTLYGVGGTVGPDLTGSQRANLDYVLQNVVDPSALISNEYQVTLIRTKDRRVVSGIASETGDSWKVVTEAGTVLVPRDEVDKVRKSELSMMPEGLLNGRSESEVADLVAYLRTANQVPLPAEGRGGK